MTCKHQKGDPNCSSHPSHPDNPANRREREEDSMTPDKKKYQIVDAHRVGKHLVLKVLYPNCRNCSYEGNKVMVFFNVTELDVLKWAEIDPHFRNPKASRSSTQAPGPAARFPASDEGWRDAIDYATRKVSL